MSFNGDKPDYPGVKKESVSVLLVEDDAGSRGLVKQALRDNDESVNYNIKIAEDLATAKELLSTCSFDNVLLDLCLPDSRGIETLHGIQSVDPDVPIVVLSAVSDHETAIESIRSGADYYIVKGSMLKEVLGRSICFSIVRKRSMALTGNQGKLSGDIELLRSQVREVKEALSEQVTCRNNAEDKLEKAINENKVLLDSLAAMIWHVDLDGRIIRLNRQAAGLLGKQADEFVGKDFYDLFAGDAEYLRQQFKKVVVTGKTQAEKIGVFKTNLPFLKYATADVIPYREDGEDVSGVIVFAQAISETDRSGKDAQAPAEPAQTAEISGKFRSDREFHNSRQDLPEKSTKKYSGKVLVADDDSMNRMLININLRDTGLEVAFARNGREAIDKASGSSFDLIMISIQMPVIDGLGVTRQLRQLGVDTPVVVMTTDLRDEAIQKCDKAGVSAHISKPINKKDVFEVLDRFLTPSKSI